MVVIVELVALEGDRPPQGTPIRVEVRDTSLADAAAVTVAAVDSVVRGQLGSWLDTVEIEFDAADGLTVWALADVDEDGGVGSGDYITQASHPVPDEDESRLTVTLRRV
jgi:hypothetical protein